MALIAGNVLRSKDGVDFDARNFVNSAEQSRNAYQLAAVISEAAHGSFDCPAGRSAGDKQQNALAPDHGLSVVAEDHLIVAVLFGCYYAYVRVVIDRMVGAAAEGFGEKRSYHLRALKAYYRINRCIAVNACQHFSRFLGVFKLALHFV